MRGGGYGYVLIKFWFAGCCFRARPCAVMRDGEVTGNLALFTWPLVDTILEWYCNISLESFPKRRVKPIAPIAGRKIQPVHRCLQGIDGEWETTVRLGSPMCMRDWRLMDQRCA